MTKKGKIYKGLGKSYEGLPLHALLATTQLMAHTRKMTQGAITIPNAHPLLLPGIAGCHNGSVSNHSELNKQRATSWEVDSSHIFHYIRQGWDLQEVQAYGAITFVRSDEPKRLYFAKLGGSLEVAGIGTSSKEKDKDHCLGSIYASTKFALEEACEVAQIRHCFLYKIDDYVLYYFENGIPVDSHIKLDFGKRATTTTYYNNWQGNSWKDDRKTKSSRTIPLTSGRVACDYCTAADASWNTDAGGFLCKDCAAYEKWIEGESSLELVRAKLCVQCKNDKTPFMLCNDCHAVYADEMKRRDGLPEVAATAGLCNACTQLAAEGGSQDVLCKACLRLYVAHCLQDSTTCDTLDCTNDVEWLDAGKSFCSGCYQHQLVN